MPLLPAPLLSFLPPYKASQYTAGGSLASRSGPPLRSVWLCLGLVWRWRAGHYPRCHLRHARGALRAPAGRPPWAGCPPGQEGGPGGPRSQALRVPGDRRRMLVLDAARAWAGVQRGATRPHTPRWSLRSAVGRTVFYCRAVCCRAPVAGACSFPLTARRGGGAHGGGRPLAAARGCRLLRRFSSSSSSAM